MNLSLGDRNRPFTGPMSPWGRLLDYLAERFGILFVVSAGNVTDPLPVPTFTGTTDLEAATAADRQKAILSALDGQRSQRTLLSPAEALNVITVGAWNEDAVGGANGSGIVYEPYVHAGPNITSALGGTSQGGQARYFHAGRSRTLQYREHRWAAQHSPRAARTALRLEDRDPRRRRATRPGGTDGRDERRYGPGDTGGTSPVRCVVGSGQRRDTCRCRPAVLRSRRQGASGTSGALG